MRLEEAQQILNQTDSVIQERILAWRCNNIAALTQDSIDPRQLGTVQKNATTGLRHFKLDQDVLPSKIRESRSKQCHTAPSLIAFGGLKSAEQRLSSSIERLKSRRMLHNQDLARTKPYHFK
ncbi:hypothetical protein BVRB_021560 [Beta vulgaris subsp. vulgaris]|uniref:Uncharacterized protein n=1 Tax=Beta vulgaris subsp. vulgaris TaxID=3555 RepID=A0A0J8B3I6_BETVV|nr:hypothetical protein BVRB_021560 [Beta vulgaris subsp. vulgaris]